MTTRHLACVAALIVVVTATAHAGPTPDQQCRAGQNKAAGKYAACRQTAAATLSTSGDVDKHAHALAKCAAKFLASWAKLQANAVKAGASCDIDALLVQAKLDAPTHGVAALIAGDRFEDNADGTVTDHRTALQWERKSTAVGSGANAADPHDVDNLYSLNIAVDTDDPTLPANWLLNGTAFTDFVAKLNGATVDGATTTGCFANHCDWRLPTILELQTVLLEPYPCATSPCLDPIFGPTQANNYWSATSDATNPFYAWHVSFNDGGLYPNFFRAKYEMHYVRAVRGGTVP